MGLEHIAEQIVTYRQAQVQEETFGHLAPEKNKKHAGRVVFAFGIYDCGELNPVVLLCDFGELPDSPWFYRSLHEDLLDRFTPGQEGTVWEWKGSFRNYRFTKGKHRLVLRLGDRP